MPVFKRNKNNSEIDRFGINSNSKKLAKKPEKLLKLRKTLQFKKLSKSWKLLKFNI